MNDQQDYDWYLSTNHHCNIYFLGVEYMDNNKPKLPISDEEITQLRAIADGLTQEQIDAVFEDTVTRADIRVIRSKIKKIRNELDEIEADLDKIYEREKNNAT